jgi:hypothetical protein
MRGGAYAKDGGAMSAMSGWASRVYAIMRKEGHTPRRGEERGTGNRGTGGIKDKNSKQKRKQKKLFYVFGSSCKRR